MKILYVNPNINHHKLPFFMELQSIHGEDEVIYATPILSEDWRSKMGFENIESKDWLFHITKENFSDFCELFNKAEIVLCSVRDYWKLMEQRLKKDKLTFYFSERWFKEPIGKLRIFHPRILNFVRIFHRLSKYEKFYYLAQGDTAAEDFYSVNIARNKTFRFGYFPPLKIETSSNQDILLPEECINILWAGRIIKTKHVDLLAKAFVFLSKKYNNIHLTIVGEGPKRKLIEKILKKGCNSTKYNIYDFLPNNEVRQIMRQADIYVLPSSGWEGWGAVVNEAMSESCAIVGGDRIGAVKSIFDERFGIKFASENLDSLISAMEELIINPSLIETQKRSGYYIINSDWSPRNAAVRFSNTATALLNNQDGNIYQNGLMSLI